MTSPSSPIGISIPTDAPVLLDYEGRRLTERQIGQLEQCRKGAHILRAAGFACTVVEYMTCGDPKSDAAGIRIKL